MAPDLSTMLNQQYIANHRHAFDVESVYALDIFERFAAGARGWGLECGCKIQKDRLYPARFNMFRTDPQVDDYTAVLRFFHRVATRVGVTLDDGLMRQFLGSDFDSRKVAMILVGVDLRQEVSKSRLKFWFALEDYPEKLALAVTLCGGSIELRALLDIDPSSIVGFDFFFNGRSAIELYPSCDRKAWQRADVKLRLAAVLSPPALRLMDGCSSIMIGFSTANTHRIVYYSTENPSSLIAKLRHDVARRVHAYYSGRAIKGAIVGIGERELRDGLVQNVNLYYQMSYPPRRAASSTGSIGQG